MPASRKTRNSNLNRSIPVQGNGAQHPELFSALRTTKINTMNISLFALVVIFFSALQIMFIATIRPCDENLKWKVKSNLDLGQDIYIEKALRKIQDANEMMKSSIAELQETLKPGMVRQRKSGEEDKSEEASSLQEEQGGRREGSQNLTSSVYHRLIEPSKSFKPSSSKKTRTNISEAWLEAVKREYEKRKNEWQIATCRKWMEDYNVSPGSHWGDLPSDEKELWTTLECDCFLIGGGCTSEMQSGSLPYYVTFGGILEAVSQLQPDAHLPCRSKSSRPLLCTGNFANVSEKEHNSPVVAVLIATSSRGQAWSEVNQSLLLTYSLPSLFKYMETGFRYHIYIGYDADDTFYSSEAVQRDILKWIWQASREKPFHTGATLLVFDNNLHKPGPVFNFLSAVAMSDGADFIYRINDDTRMLGPFATAFVGALADMRPPHFGVVGPECRQANRSI